MITQTTETFAEIGTPTNPFPGLRPFEFDESHLFFGRDGQSEQLIGKLARTRFLAVVGSSGSGKSSLVRAGLLPALLGGFMTSAGSDWQIAIMRPGNDPVGNLARALNAPDVFGSEIEENAGIQTAIAEANLRRGSLGLVEAVRQNSMPDNENLLVLVDQFEELFRFAREASRKTKDESERYQNDAAAFVKLLLEAHSQREANIYVVLTMRSDFLGDCAQFWDLPETVNESQYLTPRLTRDQLREAITGPVAVGGGEITQRLVNRLLNDVGDSQDQLPVLQHLLMRAWDEWKEKRLEVEVKEGEGTVRRPHKEVHQGEAIDLCCYEAVGGMAEALSRHADEAFNELPDDRHREVAEKLFKALTEKGPDNREIRRPIMLGEICAVAHAAIAEVITVVDTFRLPGRSFLMPPAGVALNSESLIDISHESLIRGWTRLRDWVEEEARSARIYRRLAETAELHRESKAGLWGDPDLQFALDWQEKNAPNKGWAQRYDPNFDTAIAFLQASEHKRADDIAERERHQRDAAERAKRELEQAKALAEAQQQRAEAERQKVAEQQQRLEDQVRSTSRLRRLMAALVFVALLAMAAAVFAFAAQRTAKAESIRANEQARIAEDGKEILMDTLEKLNVAKNNADTEKNRAEALLVKANEQAVIAERRKREAEHAKFLEKEQRIVAERNLKDANQQRLIAGQQGQTLAKRLSRLLAVQSDVVRRASDTSLDLSALLAVESSKLSSPVGDQALRSTLSLLPRRLSLTEIGDRAEISAFSQDGRYLATVSAQQTVRVWEAATGQLRARTMPHGSEVIYVTLNPDGEYLATLGNDHSVRVWRAGTGQPVGRPIKPEDYVTTMALSPDGSHLATAGGDTAQMWEVSTGETFGKAMKHGDVVSAMSFSLDGNYLATGCGHRPVRGNPSRLSAAYIWKAATGEQVGEPIGQSPSGVVNSVAISRDGRYLAMAGAEVQVWDMSSRQKLGDMGAVGSSVVFSPDGKYLAAIAGERVWVRSFDFANNEALVTPVALMFHDVGVSSLAFTADGKRLLTVSDDAIATWERTSHVGVAEIPEVATRDIVFTSDSRHLLTGGVRGFQEWIASTGEPTGPAMRDSEVRRALNREIASFSLDGRYLATMVEGDDTKVWDTNTRKVIARLKQEPWIKLVTFSPDGEYLATINEDRTIRLFNFDNAKELLRLSEGVVTAIAVSPQRQYLATVSEDNTVRVRELTLDGDESVREADRKVTGSTEIARISHATEVRAVIFSRNGRNFATASGNTVRIWESATGRPVGRPMEHQGVVLGIAFSSDGDHLATGGQDKSVRVWDVMTSQPVGPTLQHEGSVNAVAFDAFGSKYLATSSENTARVWEWATGQLLGPPIRTEGKVVALVLHGNRTLTTADESHKVQTWKVTAGEPAGELPLAYGEAVPAVALSPYGGYLVTGSRSVRKVYLPTGVQVSSFGDMGEIKELAISADGKRVATADEGGAVQVWSVANQQVVARMLHKHVHVIGFSPDGKYLASGGDQDHMARVWNAATGEPIGKPLEHKSGVRAIAFSPDGKYLATGDADRVAQVWEAITGLPGKPMSHGGYSLSAIGFSRDGKYLVTGGEKDTQVWDLATGERVATMSKTGAKLAFSPDGRFLATLGFRDTQIWLWPPKELASDACARLIRNFTAEEWQQYVGDEPYRRTCEGLPIHPSFIKAGIDLAQNGDLEGATKIFEQLAKLEPGLKIDPKAEASWNFAVKQVDRLVTQTIGLEARDKVAKLQEAIDSYKRHVAEGRSRRLYAVLGVAPLSETFNTLCWDGSLNGRAADVIDACELLVSSAPRRWDYRDSRGLARALTGDLKGAIEDFQSLIEWSDREEYKEQRKRWIEALRAGKNPFTPQELNKLRGQ